MTATAGFFVIPRVDADLFGEPMIESYCKRGAFHWLFENAVWKTTDRQIGAARIRLERGELCFSYRYLARAWVWTHGRVQRWLQLLAQRGLITIRQVAGMIVVSLRDYARPAEPVQTPATRSVDSVRSEARRGHDASQRRKEESSNKDSEVDRERYAPVADIRAALGFRRKEPKPTATPEGRKQARIQALFRWINAKLSGAKAQAAIAGLLADDPTVAQRWFDMLDRRARAAGWRDAPELAGVAA